MMNCNDVYVINENNNQESLANVIRGSLTGYYNQILTPEIIDKLTYSLLESIELYMATRC